MIVMDMVAGDDEEKDVLAATIECLRADRDQWREAARLLAEEYAGAAGIRVSRGTTFDLRTIHLLVRDLRDVPVQPPVASPVSRRRAH